MNFFLATFQKHLLCNRFTKHMLYLNFTSIKFQQLHAYILQLLMEIKFMNIFVTIGGYPQTTPSRVSKFDTKDINS